MAKKEKAVETVETKKYDNSIRRWTTPSKRAKGYAEDRKAKVHTYGKNEGKALTEYQLGMRSGYLQCQSDHAGLFKYKEALNAGKTKAEAKRISRQKGKKAEQEEIANEDFDGRKRNLCKER